MRTRNSTDGRLEVSGGHSQVGSAHRRSERGAILPDLNQALIETARQAGAEAVRANIRDLARLIAEELRDVLMSDAMQLRTIDQFAKENPAIKKSRLYQWSCRREINGLLESRAIVEIDGRMMIHKGRFDRWLDRQLRRTGSARPSGPRRPQNAGR